MNDLGINRVSPSMLMQYEKCPKSFFYSSWLGIKLPQAQRHFKFGTAIHLAIDNIYEQHDEKDHWSLAELPIVKNIFKREWTIDCIGDDEFPTLEDKQKCYEDMREDGLLILDHFWASKEAIKETGFEPQKFELVVKRVMKNMITGEPFEVPHSMRLDAECKNDVIGEFKTSASPYDESETRESLQALSYAYEKFERTGIIPRVDYIVMVKKRKKNKIQHFSIQFTESEMLGYCERVTAILDRVRNREFDRPTKGHMPYCDCWKFDELFANT